ncbi:MAG: class I SAM-dependent methyltransferase [Deltaproteobacteria bacterium]|nr:class I SAM-dependent methyltransferase [Deltaproteobacteria bacterium]
MDEKTLSRYNSPEGATDYVGKFDRRWTERINDWNEQRLLRRLLHSAGVEKVPGVALDLPCGCGRLYPIVREVADRVVEGDWSFHMLLEARLSASSGNSPGPASGFVRGTALTLPFIDRAFDFVLSVRLCHHIGEHAERIQYVWEVMRVSGKWLVFTYFDQTSLKNRLREFNRRFNGKRAKRTLHPSEVAALARSAGFDVVRSVPMSRLFSGHRYAVLRRKGDIPASAPERSLTT